MHAEYIAKKFSFEFPSTQKKENSIGRTINKTKPFFIVAPCILIYVQFTQQQMHFY